LINLRDRTITCPAGEIEPIDLGADVEFNPDACDRCELRDHCTADGEFLQQRLRRLTKTRTGRGRVREHVAVEHSLAHLSRRQGRRARYHGVRNNLFDVRRTAAVQNLEILHRRLSANDTVNGSLRNDVAFKPLGALVAPPRLRRVREAPHHQRICKLPASSAITPAHAPLLLAQPTLSDIRTWCPHSGR
jgi:hypothetical protein